MRRRPTATEEILWLHLRNGRLDGFKFRRQHAIGQFIVDFYCSGARLVVEIDGLIHRGRVSADAARQLFLEAKGLSVLRLSAGEVESQPDAAVQRIRRRLLSSPSPDAGEGSGV